MPSFIKGKTRAEKNLLFICFYIFVCNGALTLMQGSLLPDLKQSYGISDTLSGLFLSEQSIGNLLAGFLGGLLPMWIGQKRSIALLCSLALIGFVMMIVWGNPVWLFAAFLLIGISRGGGTNFTNRHVNRLSDGAPSASNMLHACYAAGAVASPLVFMLIGEKLSWKWGAGFVILLLTARQVSMLFVETGEDTRSASKKKDSTMRFMKDPAFLILIVMMFCYLCTEYAVCGWLVTFLQSRNDVLGSPLGMTVQAYSQLMAMLMWVVILFGRLICAAVSNKDNRKKIIFASAVGCAAAYAGMLLSKSPLTITLSVAAMGFCLSGISPMVFSDAAPFTNAYPMATGALISFGSIGGIAMPTVVGAIADRSGIGGGMTAILVTACLLVVFSFANVFIRSKDPNVKYGR